MGCHFEITVVADNERTANNYTTTAINEIVRIEKLISSWDENSQTSEINRNAGIKPVQVNQELFELIERSLKISNLTDGAFDITYASMDRVWKFDGSMQEMPDASIIENSVRLIDYKKVILDKSKRSVFLSQKGMRIGFGGIGKGYAADKAKAVLIKQGVKSGIINASGDMNAWGKKPDGKSWEVAITNPMDKKKAFGLLPIQNGAVVTSGNYEKFVVFDGKRYTHIIDPRTGYPASDVISATVFAPKAELADALATSVFIMGIDAGIDRINQLPNIECIIVDNNGQLYQSENIKLKNQ